MPNKKRFKDFESAIERLEQITALLESGQSSLEESIGLYTEGLEIARFCDQKLSETEKKIKVIQDRGGVLTETDEVLFDNGGEGDESTCPPTS